jgi:hypothetical protein
VAPKANPFALGMRWGRLVANLDRAVNAVSGVQGECDLIPEDRDAVIAMADKLFAIQQRAWKRFAAVRDARRKGAGK